MQLAIDWVSLTNIIDQSSGYADRSRGISTVILYDIHVPSYVPPLPMLPSATYCFYWPHILLDDDERDIVYGKLSKRLQDIAVSIATTIRGTRV